MHCVQNSTYLGEKPEMPYMRQYTTMLLFLLTVCTTGIATLYQSRH